MSPGASKHTGDRTLPRRESPQAPGLFPLARTPSRDAMIDVSAPSSERFWSGLPPLTHVGRRRHEIGGDIRAHIVERLVAKRDMRLRLPTIEKTSDRFGAREAHDATRSGRLPPSPTTVSSGVPRLINVPPAATISGVSHRRELD